jgi:hypothetical protein
MDHEREKENDMADLTARAAGPWYREPWPWLLMLGPALVIVAGSYTLWLAVSTSDGLVADDYYKQGLAINRRLARDDAAARLGLAATVHAEGGAIAVRLTHNPGLGVTWPATLTLTLLHPTRAGLDQSIVLARSAEGDYEGRMAALAPGRWNVAIEYRDWRLTGQGDAPFIDGVLLRPGS